MERLNRNPWVWLLLGAVFVIVSQVRFGIGALAWLAPVPWLHYLRLTGSPRARVALVGASMLAWSLAFLKIVTAPLPPPLAFGFGVPTGFVMALPYLGWDLSRPRLGEGWGTGLFAALVVVAEWSLHGLLPLGTWGALANTQLDQLALLQLASLTGLHGVSFLMALAAAAAERVLTAPDRPTTRAAAAVAVLALAVVTFGQIRLTLSTREGLATRRVAAVGTDSEVGRSPELPGPARLRADEQGLVARTELAAAGGASLVVWNEGATMAWPADEPAFVERQRELAARLGIDLVAAYVVPTSEQPLRYENKFVFIRSDGVLDHEYLKHEPVPGEPAVRGEGPAPVVGTPGEAAVAGAICYDYDFPYLGLSHARSGADIVALPSSDWRGIDPLHTRMAALRAIEGGHSVVRSTRFGLSALVDPWGRMRASASHFDGEQRVLIGNVPMAGIQTVYGRLGDWFPAACALMCLTSLVQVVRRRRVPRPRVVPSPHGRHSPVGGIEGSA